MARCMLCSSPAGEADVVCARCGGALEDDPTDATRVQGPDLTKQPSPPTGPPEGWGPPAGPPSGQRGPMGPPPEVWGPPSEPYGVPPGGPPPSLGGYGGGYPAPGPPGYGPPGYGPPAYGPGPCGPPGYGYPGFAIQPPMEGMAIGAFVTALVGLCTAPFCYLPILACPVGAVLGHVALRRIDEQGKGGRGLALAGAIIGWIGTALLALGLVVLAIVLIAAAGSSGGA